MGTLFEVKDVDRRVYREKLETFLPDRMIDAHVHLWRESDRGSSASAPKRTVGWPALVAAENPVEDLLQTYRLMFPGKQVTPLAFSIVRPGNDFDRMNAYVSDAASQHGFDALLFAHPSWSAEELERRVIAGGFVGIKVYLNHAPEYIPGDEIRIFDYLPHHQLEVLADHRWIVMLHIPRSGRLGDPVNLAQMLEIERRYPTAQVIIAHVGRAYCPQDIGDAFERLRDTEHMLFDFSANTNAECFEQLIRAVGAKRILFGSDLPILRMRTRRICENGRYVNLVPRGLYGDVSDDPHMREVDGSEADSITFFMYEELLAFRAAAETTGLSRADIEDVFFHNAERVIAEASRGE